MLPRAEDRARQLHRPVSAWIEGEPMRPSKFTDVQVAEALRQVNSGTPAVHVCRTLGITQTTFYRWRKKHEGVSVPTRKNARALRDENLKLKELVADLLLQGGTPALPAVRRRLTRHDDPQ